MANLEAMRTFQRHWSSYRADERRLARLCTQLPLRCDRMTADERRRPLFIQPDSISYDHAALEGALGADGARWGYRADEGSQWGWWLADDAWRAIPRARRLLEDRAAACAELAAVASACQASKDADPALGAARRARRGYLEADAAEHAELDGLLGQRAEAERPYAEEAARKVPWPLRPWHRLRLWALRRFALRDELDRIDQKIAGVRTKLEVRERKLDELRAQEAARTSELEEPFEAPASALLAALREVESAAVRLYDRDLAARDASYEPGALAELPFDEAMASASEREWALLGEWMAAYAERLPEEVVHTRNVVESELVWLEGYAPYGKRYWPLTDEVVGAMEQGRADTSELALKLVRR